MNYSWLKLRNKNIRDIHPSVSSRYGLMQTSVRCLKAGQVRKRKGRQGLWGGEGVMERGNCIGCVSVLLLIKIWNILLEKVRL
jgi:hypothetical protein